VKLITNSVLAGVLGVALGCHAQASHAQSLGFLRNSPLAQFTDQDRKLLNDNALSVLESSQPNAKSSWSNPRTGSSGEAEVRVQFTSTDGFLCKRLRVFNQSRTSHNEVFFTVCRYTDGRWRANPDARPRPPAASQ
jgi:surface antigen